MGIQERWQDFGTQAKEHSLYFREFLKNPKRLSAIAPTCWSVIDDLAREVPGDAKRIIEIGSGSGRLIRTILGRNLLPEDGRILSLELNERFVDFQRKTINDDRVDIVHGNAEDLRDHAAQVWGPHEQADIAFASLPFSFMQDTREKIFEQMRTLVAAEGKFIVYIITDIRAALNKYFHVNNVQNLYGHLAPLMTYVKHDLTPRDRINGHHDPGAMKGLIGRKKPHIRLRF